MKRKIKEEEKEEYKRRFPPMTQFAPGISLLVFAGKIVTTNPIYIAMFDVKRKSDN